MSLSEESFPDDDRIGLTQYEQDVESCDKNKTANGNNSDLSTIGRSSSGLSGPEKSSEDTSHDDQFKSKPIYKQKAHSYQDLHSDYTKRKYQNVKSKVKEYIANITASDRVRSKKIIRHRSLPETIGHFSEYEAIIADEPSTSDIVNLLREKDQEIIQLRTRNENLESNIQEKLAMVVRLKMNADNMRFELLEIKEKEKQKQLSSNGLRYAGSHRYSLPTINSFPVSTGSASIATQTDDRIGFDAATINEIEEGLPDFICSEIHKNLRRRTYSNSLRYDDSELNYSKAMIDLENCPNEESTNEIANQDELTCGTNQRNDPAAIKRRRKLFKRRSWRNFQRFLLCCSHIPDSENDYFYKQIPFEDLQLIS